MPEHKHTAGPWSVFGSTVYKLNEDGVNLFDARVQQGWKNNKERTSNAECEANARLIAAAPDLLEALELVMERLVDRHELDEAALMAHTAIAKATCQA